MNMDQDTFRALYKAILVSKDLPEAADWTNAGDVLGDLEDLKARLDKGKETAATMRIVQFFTDEKKQAVLGLDPAIHDRLMHIQKEYNEGADWVGVLMAVYNGFAAIMAFFLIWLARLTSRKTVHAISLVVGGLSLISFLLIGNPRLLLLSELGIGLAWASILAMPYAILTGSLPQNKLGTYMGIFNFFIVIPQILAATILGFFVRHLADGQPIYALVLGGASMIIAAALVMFVQDVDAPGK
jgi:MFS family permease